MWGSLVLFSNCFFIFFYLLHVESECATLRLLSPPFGSSLQAEPVVIEARVEHASMCGLPFWC